MTDTPTYILKPRQDEDRYTLWDNWTQKGIFTGTWQEMYDYISRSPNESNRDIERRLALAETTGTSDTTGVVGGWDNPVPGV